MGERFATTPVVACMSTTRMKSLSGSVLTPGLGVGASEEPRESRAGRGAAPSPALGNHRAQRGEVVLAVRTLASTKQRHSGAGFTSKISRARWRYETFWTVSPTGSRRRMKIRGS